MHPPHWASGSVSTKRNCQFVQGPHPLLKKSAPNQKFTITLPKPMSVPSTCKLTIRLHTEHQNCSTILNTSTPPHTMSMTPWLSQLFKTAIRHEVSSVHPHPIASPFIHRIIKSRACKYMCMHKQFYHCRIPHTSPPYLPCRLSKATVHSPCADLSHPIIIQAEMKTADQSAEF